MPRNVQLSTTSQNLGAAAIVGGVNGGKARVYDGIQPAANGAVTTQTKGAELSLANPAGGSPSAGEVTLSAIAAAANLATIKATWFRTVASDGTTIGWDGNVGSGVLVIVGAAGAAQGATSVPCNALLAAIHSGATIRFASGKTATLTADAALGATSLAVSALSAALSASDYGYAHIVVVDTGGAAASATSVPVKALSAPIYAGTVLSFGLTPAGVEKTLTVTSDAAAGATSLACSALPAALAAGDNAEFALLLNSASLVQNVELAIGVMTFGLAAAGR